MGANFETAINYVLQNEGGFVDDPSDSGGATSFGITESLYHSVFPGRLPIRDLSLDDAKRIYFEVFWKPLRLAELNSQAIATAILDQAVNRGPTNAVKLAQEVTGAKIDGIMGNDTIRLLNDEPENSFVLEFKKQTERFYLSLVENHIGLKRFLQGWLNRANRLVTLV